MKIILPIVIILLDFLCCKAQQTPVEGSITHITSANVYVRFGNTQLVNVGDTLYVNHEGEYKPVLLVTAKSSLSCVCKSISDQEVNLSAKVYLIKNSSTLALGQKQATKGEQATPLHKTLTDTMISGRDSLSVVQPFRQQQINGRVSVASYNNLSNSPAGNFMRMRYTLSMKINNIADSRLSAETYVSFVHKSDNWGEIQNNIFNGLKIYNLALIYDVTNNLRLTAGRKINPRLSNMGAADGLQAEYNFQDFSAGVIMGTRPDYLDYSFNTSLFQYGVYFSHQKSVNKGDVQTTVAFVDQKNTGITDRRFTYLQHSNSMINNLYFFGSAEFDLYKMINNNPDNSPNLTNLYLSLRYRILRNLSLSVSYSARKNIIYYETYKTFLERLIESETMQGYSARINYTPLKKLSLGANAGYRDSKKDPAPSKNAYIYVTYNAIPLVDASMTISTTILETSYLSCKVYSIGVSRDLFKHKVNSSLAYRYSDYNFMNSQTGLLQNSLEASINWQIIKKLSFSLSYEGTFEKDYTFTRFFLQLSKRF